MKIFCSFLYITIKLPTFKYGMIDGCISDGCVAVDARMEKIAGIYSPTKEAALAAKLLQNGSEYDVKIQWGIEDVQSAEYLEPVDTSKAPDRVFVRSIYSHMDGGYRRTNAPGSYPVYIHTETGCVLWHDRKTGEWRISSHINSEGMYAYAKNRNVDPSSFSIDEWGGAISLLERVSFNEEELDDDRPEMVLFLDRQFRPTYASLGRKQKAGLYIQWIRASRLFRDYPMVLFDQMNPCDMMKENLECDDWLLSAIACIAEYPAAIKSLFKTREFNPEGRYEIKMYNVVTSKWHVVEIDDQIPCKRRAWFEREAWPLFAQCPKKEIFLLLLEKAFAKVCGSYEALKGGRTLWAWQILTGVEDQYMLRKSAEGSWKRSEIDLEEQRRRMLDDNDRRCCPMRRRIKDPILTGDQLFLYLNECDINQYLMSASIPSSDNPEGELERRKDGLVVGHNYSIIQAYEAGEFKMVELRNAWGPDLEWNGDWSENSDLWDKHPDVSRTLEYTRASPDRDGAFWMSFHDFKCIFSCINVCPSEFTLLQTADKRKRSLAQREKDMRLKILSEQDVVEDSD